MLGTLVLSVAAYFDGNRHCAIDQFGKGCGRLRWAAVQLKRRSIARCADSCPVCAHLTFSRASEGWYVQTARGLMTADLALIRRLHACQTL